MYEFQTQQPVAVGHAAGEPTIPKFLGKRSNRGRFGECDDELECPLLQKKVKIFDQNYSIHFTNNNFHSTSSINGGMAIDAHNNTTTPHRKRKQMHTLVVGSDDDGSSCCSPPPLKKLNNTDLIEISTDTPTYLPLPMQPQCDDIHTLLNIERPLTDLCTGVLSLDGRILDCNGKFGEVAGYPRENLIDRTVFSIFSQTERAKIFGLLDHLFRGQFEEESLAFDTAIVHSNSQVVPMRVMVRPLYDNYSGRIPKALLWVAKPLQPMLTFESRPCIEYNVVDGDGDVDME